MPDERQHNDSVDENMTVAPVRNGNGEITHFIAVKQDTIDQGRGEERASMLAQAVQNSSDLIGIANRAGEFTFVNEAVLKMIGYHPKSSLENTLAHLSHLIILQLWRRALAQKAWKAGGGTAIALCDDGTRRISPLP
jgi:PAS domain-containing protein